MYETPENRFRKIVPEEKPLQMLTCRRENEDVAEDDDEAHHESDEVALDARR